MKTMMAMVLTLAFSLVLMATVPVQAQDSSDQAALINAIATAKSGTYKVEVVSCDAAKNTCTVKGKKGNVTADMRYAQYNGNFNAAKDLKPGAKIKGNWKQIKDGKIFAMTCVDE
jgi:hypothetical protein